MDGLRAVPQAIIGTPRTSGTLDVTALARFNMTLNEYGCATPRHSLPSRQHVARLRQIDPKMQEQLRELTMARPLITPRSQRILEHRRDMEQCRIQESIAQMFPHPPGFKHEDRHSWVQSVMHKQKSKFVGPKSPELPRTATPPLRRTDSGVLKLAPENISPVSPDEERTDGSLQSGT